MIQIRYKKLREIITCFCINNASLLMSALIFLSIILLLGLPYQNWGFFGDDFGNILNTKINKFSDVVTFFRTGNVAHLFFPSNYVEPHAHFFNVMYRPMVMVAFGIASMFLGVNAKAYFAGIVLLHAINSVLLFKIYTYFTNYFWSFWGAMFFAYHPILCGWFGWIAAWPYQSDLFILICLFFLLKKYLETSANIYLCISGILYLMALFIRETLIVLPVIIVLALFMVKGLELGIKKYLYVFFVFAYGALTYLITRLYLYPFHQTQFHSDFLPRIWNGIFLKFFYLAYALPGLYVFSPNNMSLRYVITFLFFSLLLIIFIFSTKKRVMLFLIFTICSLSWCQLYNYSNRYIYEVLPFFILFFLIGITYFKSPSKTFNFYMPRVLGLFLCFALIQSIFFVKKDFKEREARSIYINTAFDELVSRVKIKNRTIFFIDVPCNYFLSGIAQAIWLRGCNVGLPIYAYEFGLGETWFSNIESAGNVFSRYLKNLEKTNDVSNGKSIWVFWDKQKRKFFEVDFYENNIYKELS